jgi:hypothetical protein
MSSIRHVVEGELAKDRLRRSLDGDLLAEGGARLPGPPSPADLDAAFRASPFQDRKAPLTAADAILALVSAMADVVSLPRHLERGLPAADNTAAWQALAREDVPRPLAKAIATTVTERALERGCAAAFTDGSDEERGRWFREPWRAAEQALAVCERSDAVGFAPGVVAWHLLARVLPRRALVCHGAIFFVHEAEVAFDWCARPAAAEPPPPPPIPPFPALSLTH